MIDAITYDMVISCLAAHRCAWRPDDTLTFDDQVAIRTDVDVSLVFSLPDASDAHSGPLASIYTRPLPPIGGCSPPSV